MQPSTQTTYCQCCGHDRPSSDFYAGAIGCSLCLTRPANEIITLTRETMRREYAVATYTKNGRKAARVAAKMEKYHATGKRCTACHHPKPPEAYNKCAPMPDGLQPICRSCNALRVASIKGGAATGTGMQTWHAIRAALRASSPEGK